MAPVDTEIQCSLVRFGSNTVNNSDKDTPMAARVIGILEKPLFIVSSLFK